MLAALILLGFLLRLIRLDFQPLWWDEGYSVWFAARPLADMLRLTAADIHPPLYYALLHGWSGLFGLSPAALRFFSLIAGLLAIPLAYLGGRDLRNPRAGVIAAALVAINPLAIYYSQEIRMYGLAATLSLAALWLGWRWAQPGARLRFGIAYTLALVAGLHTLYYFALLPLAQFIWMLASARRRFWPWLAALAAAGLLYLPWILFAGPKLLDYVAYKVVQDNDAPLGLLAYLGRHLSAFLVGHLEGPLAAYWPWALLLLLPFALLLLRRRSEEAPRSRRFAPALTYLALCLALPLGIAFVQQLRTPFIPPRFERILLFCAPAFWLLLAIGVERLRQRWRAAAIAFVALLFAATAASLTAFYLSPRYPDANYRPLIAAVRAQARPNDSVFAIFPWQTGYFWAYLPEETGPAIVPSPGDDWTPDTRAALDRQLSQGTVWFPEHLALGGILETAVEDHLAQGGYQLENRWFNQQTRLTAWAAAPAGPRQELAAPVAWENGVTLASAQMVESDARLFFDLAWAGDRTVDPAGLTFSLWLTDPAAGARWAQRDVTPFAQPWPPLDPAQPPWTNRDRIALAIPPGTPPGSYQLWAALLDAAQTPIALAGPTPGAQALLGEVTVAPAADSAPVSPDHPSALRGDAVAFLGHDRPETTQLPGDDLALSLYWQPVAPLSPDRDVFVQLLGRGGQVVAGLEGPPIPWLPTSAWAASAPIRSQHRLRLPADLPAGRYRLIAGLFDPATEAREQWQGRDYLDLGTVEVGVREHSFQPSTPSYPLAAIWQGGHRLLGYDLAGEIGPSQAITLTLHLQPAGPTAERYRVFVHLLGPDGAILAQHDGDPAGGALPTTAWLPGETILDPHPLHLPAALPPGPYRLIAGLYDPDTGQRLPLVEAGGAVTSDFIALPLP